LDSLLRYGLVAVLVALLLTPLGLPIPEDISLLAAGVLVRAGHGTIQAAILVGFAGVLGGDTIAWLMGRHVGLQPTGRLARFFGERHTRRIRKFYDRFGPWTVLICRQIPGLRFPAFFFAGATDMRYRRFIALDGAGAVITVSLWLTIGWWFGPKIEENLQTVGQIRWIVMGVGFALAAAVLWKWFGRPVRRSADPNADTSVPDDEPTESPEAPYLEDGGRESKGR